jgi:hypothetical protein
LVIGRQVPRTAGGKKISGRHAEMEQAESKQLDGALDHDNAGMIVGDFGLSRVKFERVY